MRYLTVKNIAFIHDEIIKETGGSLGIREKGLLESIAEKPKSSFGGQELYPTIFDKAAAFFEALCNYHVFIDGNKRTAALSLYRFLSINGYDFLATNKELEDYTIFVAVNNPDLVKVADWLKKHSRKAKK